MPVAGLIGSIGSFADAAVATPREAITATVRSFFMKIILFNVTVLDDYTRSFSKG
jgi:hypothetical protein